MGFLFVVSSVAVLFSNDLVVLRVFLRALFLRFVVARRLCVCLVLSSFALTRRHFFNFLLCFPVVPSAARRDEFIFFAAVALGGSRFLNKVVGFPFFLRFFSWCELLCSVLRALLGVSKTGSCLIPSFLGGDLTGRFSWWWVGTIRVSDNTVSLSTGVARKAIISRTLTAAPQVGPDNTRAATGE